MPNPGPTGHRRAAPGNDLKNCTLLQPEGCSVVELLTSFPSTSATHLDQGTNRQASSLSYPPVTPGTEQNGTQKTTLLTTKQLCVLPYLVTAPTIAQAASEANIGRTTLYRWLEEPSFRDELERLRREAASVAKLELRGLMLNAVGVLADAMQDQNPYIRLRAARTTMYIGLKAIDLTELEQRLDRIEDSMELWRAKPQIG